MLVFYRLVRAKRRTAYPVYAQTRVAFCCAAMELKWGRCIGFGAKDCPASTSRDVNLYALRPQANGAVVEHIAVNFCPFCGHRVEICRVK
jgi:hypothetical protein